MTTIESSRGNLLEAPVEALVNTVNTVGVMGKGIALQFKQAYPAMFQAYEDACKERAIRLGKVHVYDLGGLVGGPRWIINFPTKAHWRSPSKLQDIAEGLQDLRRTIEKLGIHSIAVPPLGCGHGGLRWDDVRALIESSLGDVEGLRVLVYPPVGKPVPAVMPNRTKRPKMTVGQAAMICLMDRYFKGLLDPILSLLELHKLMYFLQESGQKLRLQYNANVYGPYATNLRQVLIRMESHYTIGYGDGDDSPKKVLELLPGAVDEAEGFLRHDRETAVRMDRVAELMDGYEDPFGLELLSSVHWIVRQDPVARTDPERAIHGVHFWNGRKRRLFKREHIQKALQRLEEFGWLSTS